MAYDEITVRLVRENEALRQQIAGASGSQAWTEQPALPGYYWLKNWSDALGRMNYRIVYVFDVPTGGQHWGQRFLASGRYVRDSGDAPELLASAFRMTGGKPWEQLGFQYLPEPESK